MWFIVGLLRGISRNFCFASEHFIGTFVSSTHELLDSRLVSCPYFYLQVIFLCWTHIFFCCEWWFNYSVRHFAYSLSSARKAWWFLSACDVRWKRRDRPCKYWVSVLSSFGIFLLLLRFFKSYSSLFSNDFKFYLFVIRKPRLIDI